MKVRLVSLVSVARGASACALLAALLIAGCKPKDPPPDARELASSVPSVPSVPSNVPEIVPPVSPLNGTPVAQFADAGNVDGKPPFEQATIYEANGQLWMARLVLEAQALGADATTAETELLGKICVEQSDDDCIGKVTKKLGHKINYDGGAGSAANASPSASASSGIGAVHQEPDTDVAKARDLVLKNKYDDARKILEPKVLDGKASRAEVRLLKSVCESQRDRTRVALCDIKLKP
jgi:hypothetical protein